MSACFAVQVRDSLLRSFGWNATLQRSRRRLATRPLAGPRAGWLPASLKGLRRTTLAVASVFSGMVASGMVVGAPVAHAEPQISTAMTLGGGIREGEPRVNSGGPVVNGPLRGAFHLGLWGDLLFFRSRAKDMAFGPHVQIATTSFSSVDLGAGPTWLIPVGGPVLTLNLGGYARGGDHGWAPGVSAAVFLGSKSYNFHGTYALTLGGVLEAKYGLTSDPLRKHAEITLAAQIDLELLALPFVFALEAIRGPRSH